MRMTSDGYPKAKSRKEYTLWYKLSLTAPQCREEIVEALNAVYGRTPYFIPPTSNA